MKVKAKRVKLFKIKNRRGYAAICLGHLTEGRTVFQAYQRMMKALKRNRLLLEKMEAKKVKRLVGGC